MQTSVSILHHDYPPQVRAAVERELGELVERIRGVIALRVRLERAHGAHRVELVASVARAPTVVAQAQSDTFTGALAGALGRLERLLRRPRQRRQDLRRLRGRRAKA